jgi:hypothetical protein
MRSPQTHYIYILHIYQPQRVLHVDKLLTENDIEQQQVRNHEW